MYTRVSRIKHASIQVRKLDKSDSRRLLTGNSSFDQYILQLVDELNHADSQLIYEQVEISVHVYTNGDKRPR